MGTQARPAVPIVDRDDVDIGKPGGKMGESREKGEQQVCFLGLPWDILRAEGCLAQAARRLVSPSCEFELWG